MICEHILIAVQSYILRVGLCRIIHNYYPNCTMETVSSGNEIVEMYRDNPRSLCILSASAPEVDACSVLEKLDEINHYKKTMLMMQTVSVEKIENALRAGINGLFTQQCSSDEFLKILREVATGKNSYSRAVSEVMMKNYRRKQSEGPTPGKQITKRESEVLSFIVKGFTSAEIAKKLFISPRTVETHRCNLMGKLKLKNTAALVRFALQEKNIETG